MKQTTCNIRKKLKALCTGIALAGLMTSVSFTAVAADAPANPNLQDISLRYDVEQEHKLNLHYDVYAGGFKALNASLSMDLDKKAYDMSLRAETQGFIGSLFPWKATYNTSGHAEQGKLIPSVHTERSTWRSSVKTTEMDYAPDGKILKTTTQEGDKTTVKRDIKAALTANAVDMLTGTLVMMQSAKNKDKCGGSFPVFDGKRRYNITLKDGGKETLDASKYSTFEGEAMRCTVTVEPVAGFNAKDKKRGWMAVQNHTEERHRLPTLWLAKLKNSGQVVPVRMEIASEYGTVVAHLSDGQIN